MPFSSSPKLFRELAEWSLRGAAQTNPHITRVAMYKALEQRFSALDGPYKRVLSISRSKRLIKVLGLREAAVTQADYPEHNMLSLGFPSDEFDFVVSDQVLEHVEGDPFQAFRETVRVLKPGGYVCHTTCFINPIHGRPKDFWRFTPDALQLLAKDSRCQEICADAWGNKEAWVLVSAGLRRVPIPDDSGHPLHKLALRNNRKWPITVWVTARRPD